MTTQPITGRRATRPAVVHVVAHLLHLLLVLLLLPSPTDSQRQQNGPEYNNNDLWWCGSDFVDASSKCSRSCPTGSGCPPGEICYSGITTCSSASVSSSSSSSGHYCGANLEDAEGRCDSPCPSGDGCPRGEACFLDTSCGQQQGGSGGASGGSDDDFWGSLLGPSPSASSSSSSSASSSSSTGNALGGLTGAAAVEETFLQMRDAIDNHLFLYETPAMEWVPSTVYRFDGFIDGLRIMHSDGVAGKKVYLGGGDESCKHCHMYGLVNVAAFLAQAMKETIRYDACDENSWDRVGPELMYPISNSCGQLGQSYQDYHCSEEFKHMECEVDTRMMITAVTHAKWWGAPGPLKCGPKSLYPQTGYWDYMYACDNEWADPPESCDDYEGQKGGKAINDVPYPNAAGRTDVEGCCWWGRGVIQTSGVCNFGKLNYFLGKRAADEGRESKYPDIDFCRDPEAICSSQEHQELKWIAGFFYWISDVQPYESGGWNYIEELHKFVDNGMVGDGFINGVSGIVNRGCHNPPCGTGELDGGPERAQNFFDIIKEMKFSFVDVVPQPKPTPGVQSPTTESFRAEVRYVCGAEYEFDESDTSIPPSAEVTFDYEIHNEIDVTVGNALRDAKQSILSDIAERMGCYKTFSGRNLQDARAGFGSIIGLRSNANDLPDKDAAGCMVDVETDSPATCTPVVGGFTIYGKPGTSESSLKTTTNSLKAIIQKNMDAGRYETETVVKAIYIGDRGNLSNAQTPTSANSEGNNGEGLKIAIYVLSCSCLVLICLLWFTWWTYREKVLEEMHKNDEEMAFDKFMYDEREESEHNGHSMMAPPASNHIPNSRRQRNDFEQFDKSMYDEREESEHNGHSMMAPPASNHFSNSRRQSNDVGQFSQQPRSKSRRGAKDRREGHPEAAYESSRPIQIEEPVDDGSDLASDASSESFVEDTVPINPRHPSTARSQSAPRLPTKSRRRNSPPSRLTSSDDGSESSSSGGSSEDSSENNDYSHSEEEEVPVAPDRRESNNPSRQRSSNGVKTNSTGVNNNSARFNNSNASFAREERQKRMAAARARAARRQLA